MLGPTRDQGSMMQDPIPEDLKEFLQKLYNKDIEEKMMLDPRRPSRWVPPAIGAGIGGFLGGPGGAAIGATLGYGYGKWRDRSNPAVEEEGTFNMHPNEIEYIRQKRRMDPKYAEKDWKNYGMQQGGQVKDKFGYGTYQEGGSTSWEQEEINNKMTKDDYYSRIYSKDSKEGLGKYRAQSEVLNPETGKYNLEDYFGSVTPEGSHMMEPVYAQYQEGGIYIKPSKRGTFTTAAKQRGKGVQEFASQVLANKENYSPAMVKKANFAKNASKWNK